ncbi:hypothetical protein L210DRAFT_3578805 [Boletus edulis BED1]|uniref:Uncharacterized protein n=1 Tax=Boletus edulis BED1 TaxID=1328754 RepID=A0AAD4BCU6_BOLED|nr:hypothetical protein L210DRAFT_3578805 [Boletus edulis BED1]
MNRSCIPSSPRVSPSCSNKRLTELGKLAEQLPRVSIQTHISQNRKEVEEATRRFDC